MFRPLKEQSTATAIIQGLAVAKYREDETLWKVTFLRNCGHYPKLTIREVNRQTGAVISTVREYEIKEGDSISISISGPRRVSGDWKYTTAGDFDRKNTGHDPQDLRWMLDIEKLHGKKTRRKTGGIETNDLSIAGAQFYTSVRTRDSYRIKKIGSRAVEKLGLTGRTFGADFEADRVTIEIRGGAGFTEALAHKTNSRYEMIFDNTCAGEAQPALPETDFHFYYRLIDDSEGKVEILPPDQTATRATESGLSTLAVDAELSSLGTTDESAPGDTGGPLPDEDLDPETEPKRPACQAILQGVDL
jgi:hypothetical protein